MDTRNKLVQDDPYSGPYKATRLWNDVILAFRENIPCGRHRRLMRSFENCFSGSSATDWLLQYLKSSRNFGGDVSRQKAVSLLNKLYNAGIFEEVKVSKTMQHKTVVQDSRLYRLMPVSPSKLRVTRLPLAPRNDAGLNHTTNNSTLKKDKEPKKGKSEIFHHPVKKADLKTISKTSISKGIEEAEESKQQYPSCRIIPKVLSSSEISEVWKQNFVFRLKKSLGITRIADVLSEDLIDGSFIMHNCVYLNKNGTVTNIAPCDQLPQWVLSAMKCLARWPEHHEDGLPSYPGFEKDVFGVVKDYFAGLEEPLIPFQLYDAMTNIFVTASSRPTSLQSDKMFTSKERDSIIKNLWTTASLENVILDLSKKYSLLGATANRCDNKGIRGNCLVDDCFEALDNMQYTNSDRKISKGEIKSAHEDDFCKYKHYRKRRGKQQLSRSTHSSTSLPQRKFNDLPMRKFGSTPNLKVSKFETAFGPDNRTVTRVFYHNGVCTDYKHCDEEEEHNSFSPIETHFSESTEDLVHHDHPVNFERVGSLETIYFNEYDNRDYSISSKLQRKLQKSKSFASRLEKIENRNNFFPRNNTNGSLEVLQHTHDGLSYLSRSVEDEPDCMWASQESLSIHDRLQSVPECTNEFGFSPNNSLSDHVTEARSVPNSQSGNLSHQRSIGSMGHYMSHSSINHMGTPPFHSMTSLHNYLDSADNESNSFGPGYRPVLDASKERSSSTTHYGDKTVQMSSSMHSRNSHQMTSTPLSPLRSDKSISFGRLNSGTSFSNLTPLYGNVGCHASGKSRISSFMNYPQTRLSEERVKSCLQCLTLLIAPGNRRKLHMLFKMMVKMTANPNLCLDYTQTTRSLVLETFYRSIIRTRKESDMDEMLVLQMLSFMLDFYDDIFTPPNDFKTQVSERLKEMQRPQISYSPAQSTPVQYCQKKSVADYENEKNIVSRQAMEELLESIIRDAKMPVKQKHRRLKQFQLTYPTIYKKRFPTHESEAEVLQASSKPKLKPPLVVGPVNRLKEYLHILNSVPSPSEQRTHVSLSHRSGNRNPLQ